VLLRQLAVGWRHGVAEMRLIAMRLLLLWQVTARSGRQDERRRSRCSRDSRQRIGSLLARTARVQSRSNRFQLLPFANAHKTSVIILSHGKEVTMSCCFAFACLSVYRMIQTVVDE